VRRLEVEPRQVNRNGSGRQVVFERG